MPAKKTDDDDIPTTLTMTYPAVISIRRGHRRKDFAVDRVTHIVATNDDDGALEVLVYNGDYATPLYGDEAEEFLRKWDFATINVSSEVSE